MLFQLSVYLGKKVDQNDLAILKVKKEFQTAKWIGTIAPLADPHAYPAGNNPDF
jgi:hypothetical protein